MLSIFGSSFLYECFSRRQKYPWKLILCATRKAWWRKYEHVVKNLSKENTCKITVPDVAVLLCVEEILNTLYTEENAAFHLHCTRWAVNAGSCFGNPYFLGLFTFNSSEVKSACRHYDCHVWRAILQVNMAFGILSIICSVLYHTCTGIRPNMTKKANPL